jgi:NAD dependent epimerase/dehydratase family enzyme
VENTEAEGPYNIVAPQPVRNKELTKELGSIMGRPSLIPVPGSALKLVLGDVSTLVLDGRPVSSGRLQELGFEFLYPDLHSALRDLLK